ALCVTSCIQDEAPNPEADILSFVFPENSLRTRNVEIYNDYVVAYPKSHVNLRDSAIERIELSPGATYQRVANPVANDTLFYIDVTSESKQYTKRYAIMQVGNFPEHFGFETWVRPTTGFLYENPREGDLQWYSSNNGVAIAWNSPGKPAQDYPVRKGALSGSAAVELRTMEGPGNIAGAMYIPCMAGSVFLGGFNALTGLTNPLRSTLFGVPFNSGKPLKLTGYYLYTEGADDYILPDGSRDRMRKDRCDIYAVLFKTDEQVQFLYGDNIGSSPQIIARAKIRDEDIRTNEVTYFELDFDYGSFPMPFSWEELKNNVYKITIVCTSSSRGQFYEGRPGNTLAVDNLNLSYDTSGI
ncbi:MAG: PCMD domain-containing protein, partial [Tannerella sp.]|nr:PCMD domain-containing protein [Tannerella sp.]